MASIVFNGRGRRGTKKNASVLAKTGVIGKDTGPAPRRDRA